MHQMACVWYFESAASVKRSFIFIINQNAYLMSEIPYNVLSSKIQQNIWRLMPVLKSVMSPLPNGFTSCLSHPSDVTVYPWPNCLTSAFISLPRLIPRYEFWLQPWRHTLPTLAIQLTARGRDPKDIFAKMLSTLSFRSYLSKKCRLRLPYRKAKARDV